MSIVPGSGPGDRQLRAPADCKGRGAQMLSRRQVPQLLGEVADVPQYLAAYLFEWGAAEFRKLPKVLICGMRSHSTHSAYKSGKVHAGFVRLQELNDIRGLHAVNISRKATGGLSGNQAPFNVNICAMNLSVPNGGRLSAWILRGHALPIF